MADKKKIAFVANCCIVGGVETALINLLNIIDTEKYDVTLYTNFAGNPVVNNIPSSIQLVDLDKYNIKTVYREAIANHNYRLVLAILWNYAHFRLTHNRYYKTAWLFKHIDFRKIKYDCVIAYNCGTSTVFLAKEAFVGIKKVIWIHGDLPYNSSEYINALCSFDKCFCVSNYLKAHYLHYCSKMREKTELFHNILNSSYIKIKSNAMLVMQCKNKHIILTVGRISSEKGQTVIPETAKLLANAGIDFVWYLVGDGPTRDAIEQGIKVCNMEDHVYLLGTKENPYPYMKACTIYVQTSTSEGWCLTTQEARILHKPCVVTDIPVMHEQFVDGENGIIANGTDADSLYHGIMRLIESDELRNRIIDNLSSNPQDGANEIQKLYDYIEGK